MNIYAKPNSINEIGAPWLDDDTVVIDDPEWCRCCGWRIRGEVVVYKGKPMCKACYEDTTVEEAEEAAEVLVGVAGAIGSVKTTINNQ